MIVWTTKPLYMPIIYDIILFPHSFFCGFVHQKRIYQNWYFTSPDRHREKKIINKIPFLSFFWSIEFHSRCSGNSDIEKLCSLAAIKHTANQIGEWYHIDWLGFAIFYASNSVFSTLSFVRSLIRLFSILNVFSLQVFFLFQHEIRAEWLLVTA